MSDSNSLLVGTCNAVPGKITSGFLNVSMPESDDSQSREVKLPVFISQGLELGPVLVVMSGISGIDVNGISAIHKIIDEIDPKSLKGTLIYLPILNAPAYYAASKVHPYDGKMLENSFPGNLEGSITEQIANELMNSVFNKADFAVLIRDEENMATEVYAKIYSGYDIVNSKDILLQKSLAVGSDIVILELPVEGHISIELEQKLELPLVTLVTGGRGSEWINRSTEKVSTAFKNLLISNGMISGSVKLPDEQFVVKDLGGYYASVGGILRASRSLGDFVKKGELVAEIINPETGERVSISSDFSGYLYQLNQSNRVGVGDKIFVIAGIKNEKGSAGKLAKDALQVVENNEVEEPQKA